MSRSLSCLMRRALLYHDVSSRGIRLTKDGSIVAHRVEVAQDNIGTFLSGAWQPFSLSTRPNSTGVFVIMRERGRATPVRMLCYALLLYDGRLLVADTSVGRTIYRAVRDVCDLYYKKVTTFEGSGFKLYRPAERLRIPLVRSDLVGSDYVQTLLTKYPIARG